MYRKGHFGVALAIASLVIAASPTSTGVVIATITVFVEPIPDRDQNISVVSHRGFSHTIGFAVLLATILGVIVGGILQAVVTQVPGLSTAPGSTVSPSLAGGIIATGTLLGIGSHLAADMITVGTGDYGVQPFWPLSRWEFPIGLCPADSIWGNYGLLALGIVTAGVTAYSLLGGAM